VFVASRRATALRESPAPIRSLATVFRRASSRSALVAQKFFNRLPGACVEHSRARTRRAFVASARHQAARCTSSRIAEATVPQAFLASLGDDGECAADCGVRAPRPRAREKQRADPRSRRSGVVHHSLSGFAVFFVVL